MKRLIPIFAIGLLLLSGSAFAQHFTPVDATGRPYAVIIADATIDGVQIIANDEVGLFDGELCVGAAAVDAWPLPITAWEGDPAQGLEGFTAGNTISFTIWDDSEGAELTATAEFTTGNGTFGFGPFSQCTLTAEGGGPGGPHFTSVPATGRPYAIVVSEAMLNGETLITDDEIGVFDADMCVGAGIVDGTWPFPITAWEGDPAQGLDGFTAGNDILYNLWDASAETEFTATANYEVGNGTFGFGPFSQVALTAGGGQPTASVSGTVTDAATLAGIDGATVTIGDAAPVTTDADGMYQIAEMTPGDGLAVTVEAAGYVTYTGTVDIAEGENTDINFELTAELNEADIEVTPVELDFGDVVINTTSDMRITIANVGDQDLTVTSAVVTGDGFTGMVFENVVIPAGTNQMTTVTFAPMEEIDYTGMITINSDDPDEPAVEVPLMGTGIAEQGAHFTSVPPTGRPYAIIVESAVIDEETLIAGDEIGVFDEDLCVGAVIVADWPLPMTAWEGDPANELPGFTAGNDILYYFWDSSAATELAATAEYTMGNGTFGFGPFSQVALSAGGVEPAPEIDVTPMAYDFGNVIVGETATTDITISNTGNADLTVSSISVQGTSFSGDAVADVVIAGGTDYMYTVSFTPEMAQWYDGGVTILSDDADEPQIFVSIEGTGTEAAGPEIDVTPMMYDFGNVTVGEAATTDITISNTGNADLTISSISVQGTSFSGDAVADVVVAAGADYIYNVSFTPEMAQWYDGGVTILSDDADEPQVFVSLEGTGFEEGEVHYPYEPVPPTGRPYAIIVSSATVNDEPLVAGDEFGVFDADLCVGAAAIEADFPVPVTAWEGDPAQGLDGFVAGDPITIYMYDVTAQMEYTPEVEYIMGNGTFGFGPFSQVNLTAAGGPPPQTTVSGTVTDANTTAPIAGARVTMGDADPVNTDVDGMYTIPTITPGLGLAVTVVANGYDDYTGTVDIAEGANTGVDFALTPAAAAADIDVTPNSINFGDVQVGTSPTDVVIISNLGEADLTVTSISVLGTDFSGEDVTDLVIIPGDQYFYTVTFSPEAAQGYDGTVTINSDDPDEAQIIVPLEGTGVEGGPHFESVAPTGLPYAIVLDSVRVDGEHLGAGDEVGVFDGDLCVGAVILDGTWPTPVTAWQADDAQGLPGFNPGNEMLFAVFEAAYQAEWSATANVTFGNGTFGFGPFTQCSLDAQRVLANVSGTVLDLATGTGIAGATVTFRGNNPVTTDANGDYSLTDIVPGTYHVTVTAVGYQTHEEDITIAAGDNTGIDFILTAIVANVSGLVSDLDSGDPIAGATVTYEGLAPVMTDVNGMYNIPSLDPGMYNVTVTAEGYNDLTTQVTIADGDNTFNFELQAAFGAVLGHVTRMGTNVGVDGVQVTLTLEPGNDLVTTTDGGGDYVFNTVAPGTGYTMTFEHASYWTYVEENVDVIGGEDTFVDVDLTYPDPSLSSDQMVIDLTVPWHSDEGTASGTVDLMASANGHVDWTVTNSITDEDIPGVTVDPQSGSLLAGESATITLAIDLAGTGVDFVDDFSVTGTLTFDGEKWVAPLTVDVTINVTVGVNDITTQMPSEYAVYQNYPNPFNPVTHIRFDLVEAQQVKLSIYNTMGQEVARLLNGMVEAGSHEVSFEAADMPSGMYFYIFKSDALNVTRKMILMK